jgi:hypothetical protein
LTREADRADLNWSDDNNGYIVTAFGDRCSLSIIFYVETSAVEGGRRFLSCVEAEKDDDDADEEEGVKAIMYQGHPQAVNMVGCVWYIKSCIVWFTNSQIFIWII